MDIVVVGRVQGVGFRYFVLRLADSLDLVGWVANEPDGSVRCVAEGRRIDLVTLVASLGRGPEGSRVDDVRAAWGPPAGSFDRFSIRSGGHPGD